jgi:hypothetical protein
MGGIADGTSRGGITRGQVGHDRGAGGNYRLVVAFDFRRQIAFVTFAGSHAEYDNIDALTVSRY